jgi:hypothetical protein
MTFEGYLQIDPNDPSYAYIYVVRYHFSDESKFKDKTKHYILVTVRDVQNEAVIETNHWQKEYNQGREVPSTLGEVWHNYFEYCKATASVRKQNGHLVLDAQERLLKGKQGRPKGEYGKYNIYDRKLDPVWNTKIRCEKCGHDIRKNIYEIRHGDKCKNKPRYVKVKDRTENQNPQDLYQFPPNY